MKNILNTLKKIAIASVIIPALSFVQNQKIQ